MFRCLAACCLLVAATVASAVERIPADSRWVISVDLPALSKSKTGGYLREILREKTAAARLQMLELLTGVNIERDLRSVTICGTDGREETGLFMVRGTFDAAKLTTIVDAIDQHKAIAVGSRTIHTWISDGKESAGCLVAPDLLVIGRSVDRVRAAIAAQEGAYAPPVELPTGWEGSAFVLAAAQGIKEWAGKGPQSAMLANVSGVAGRLNEDGDVMVLDAVGVAVGEAQAQQLVDAGNGLRAIVQMQKPADLDPALLETLTGAQLSRKGVVVTLHARMPLVDLKRLIEQKRKGG